MDFIGNKCPVCDRYFHADDDVVVCPECGTPHHRECYENLGHCANEELHKDGYDFASDNEHNDNADVIICKSCGKENDKYQFFCKYCAAPLTNAEEKNENANAQQNRPPFGNMGNIGGMGAGTPFGMPAIDPLGGVPAEEDFGDDVTAGETAKYVKQNTPYFVRIFNNIKSFNKSKFNFAAAIFSGGYLLYRKMYKLGAIIFGLELALYISMMYVVIAFKDLYSQFYEAYNNGMNKSTEFLANLSATDAFKLYVPAIVYAILIAIMIIVGANFNRWYMKHCKTEIIRIKQNAKEDENPETLLQTKGGVNVPLAISLLITAVIIRYLPTFIVNIM